MTLDARSVLIPGVLMLVTACGGGGSGGSGGPDGGGAPTTVLDELEPNDSAATAQAITLTRPGRGSVGIVGDADWWTIHLAAGQTIEAEVFGARFDHATWDINDALPRLSLFEPDGTTRRLTQDHGSLPGSVVGRIDPGIAAFRAPVEGDYYLVVDVSPADRAGGNYCLRAKEITLVEPINLEAEPVGASGENDGHSTAEPLERGTTIGWFAQGGQDWYRFTIAEPSLAVFRLTAQRNGVWGSDDGLLNTRMTLHISTSVPALSSNEDTYFRDPEIKFVFQEVGTYLVQIEDCCSPGDTQYFLEFTTTLFSSVAEIEPNDDLDHCQSLTLGETILGLSTPLSNDDYSIDGQAGDVLLVHFFDLTHLQSSAANVSISGWTMNDAHTGLELLSRNISYSAGVINTILTTTAPVYFVINTDPPITTSYALRPELLTRARYELEPNDLPGAASVLSLQGAAAGKLGSASDVDVFAFDAGAGELVTIGCFADAEPTNADGYAPYSDWGSSVSPVLVVRDPSGMEIARATSVFQHVSCESDVDGLPTLSVSFVPASIGTYTVEVYDAHGSALSDAYYLIQKH